ncbi:hypothetical protein ACWEV3_40085 [Saccharopolyspora sp. NPDC003752]
MQDANGALAQNARSERYRLKVAIKTALNREKEIKPARMISLWTVQCGSPSTDEPRHPAPITMARDG